MKNKKWILVGILSLLILIYSIISSLTDIFKGNDSLNYAVLGLMFVLSLFILKSVFKLSSISLTLKDKLYKSLVQNSDTLYIMLNAKNKNVIYISDNVEEVLGINKNEKSSQDIVYQIMSLPVIKSELDNWDKVSNYTSGMVEYDNPKYNYQMWIRVKIYPYKDKKEEYYVVQIIDATKEHDRQHLLISQATNIKSRESVLNQITERSYDFEISINLTRNSYELRYFKKDNLYFGEEKRGIYTEELKNILEYINEKDRDLVYKNFNIEDLKEHFSKYELDSITIRYRVGNEIKNNTWLESTIFFLSDRQKNIVSILTKNVTENAESIREQNVMLQNALNEARLVSKSKTELISTISHDIRTPLTNIVGLSDTLLSEKLNNNVLDDIKNINESSNDMLNIVDNLLDASSVEKILIKRQEKNYSILKMFKKIETMAKDYIGDKQIKLNVNLDSNLPIVLYGDYIRITRAINEIVNNSIKYTDEGEININVRGEKQDNNVKVYVEVKDTGSGISEEKVNNLMQDESNRGIGAVKKLIKLLGGTFEIESIEGQYTKVTISFVQKIVEDNKVREMIKTNKEAEKFSLKGKKILVIDDNAVNLKVTAKYLQEYDVDATLLESGKECIDFIKDKNACDLILMDEMMPGMSGTETMHELRNIEGFDIPIVVLTADAMQGQKEKYLESGFDDYISKPIDKKELSRVLKEFIR